VNIARAGLLTQQDVFGRSQSGTMHLVADLVDLATGFAFRHSFPTRSD